MQLIENGRPSMDDECITMNLCIENICYSQTFHYVEQTKQIPFEKEVMISQQI